MYFIKNSQFWFAASTLVLSGCVGPLVSHIRVEPNSVATLASRVSVLNDEQSESGSYRVIQPLTATSCKNKIWDSDPTNADATNQLRVKASSVGANALANLYCESPQGTSLVTNCWASIVCHAAAVKLTDAK